MKDTTLYDELLGLKHPWYVAGVRIDVVKQRAVKRGLEWKAGKDYVKHLRVNLAL